MEGLLTIQQAISNFKNLIETAVVNNGIEGKQAMIRSQRPIMNIHDAVKSSLIEKGVAPNQIYPHLFHTKPELKLAGALKQKDQDICVVPGDRLLQDEILKDGLLCGICDPYGKDYTS